MQKKTNASKAQRIVVMLLISVAVTVVYFQRRKIHTLNLAMLGFNCVVELVCTV